MPKTSPRTIRLQSDSNAHDRPWRVAVEQGFFAAEGLEVEYHEDNPKGAAGRVEDFSQRWKESQLQKGALEVYPVCEWGAIERVQALGGGKIIGLDTTVRTGALMVRAESRVRSLRELGNVPIAVTWHAGTFYAAIEALEAAGIAFTEIKLVHANDRLDALLSGRTEAAALMDPLVSRALAAGARKLADPVPNERSNRGNLGAKRLQALLTDLIVAALGNHETTLPVFAPVDHDQDPAAIESTGGLVRIGREPAEPHPEHVHRGADFSSRQPGPFADHRVTAVRSNVQFGAHLQRSFRGLCPHPDDPSALEPGEILIAPITDPAWTPLFVAASAVVVDVGAPFSHAAIVSRELGIPCVVSATEASRRIADGALIEVNGYTGTVTILERAAESVVR